MKPNCDITLYNKYTDPSTRLEKYQRVVIYDVIWENRKAINRSKSGDIANDTAMIYIPFIRGTNHLNPIAWQALTTKTGKWTLQDGDVVVKGVVTDEIADASTDPISHVVTPAVTITSLTKKYDDVVTISSIDTMDYGAIAMQHWEVSAK